MANKKFDDLEIATKYATSTKGIVTELINCKNKYKVTYIPVVHTHKSIKFKSEQSATSFMNRLIKTGNKDVKLSICMDGVFKVKFLLTSSPDFISNKHEDNDWVEANLDGSFAYNNSSDDF